MGILSLCTFLKNLSHCYPSIYVLSKVLHSDQIEYNCDCKEFFVFCEKIFAVIFFALC